MSSENSNKDNDTELTTITEDQSTSRCKEVKEEVNVVIYRSKEMDKAVGSKVATMEVMENYYKPRQDYFRVNSSNTLEWQGESNDQEEGFKSCETGGVSTEFEHPPSEANSRTGQNLEGNESVHAPPTEQTLQNEEEEENTQVVAPGARWMYPEGREELQGSDLSQSGTVSSTRNQMSEEEIPTIVANLVMDPVIVAPDTISIAIEQSGEQNICCIIFSIKIGYPPKFSRCTWLSILFMFTIVICAALLASFFRRNSSSVPNPEPTKKPKLRNINSTSPSLPPSGRPPDNPSPIPSDMPSLNPSPIPSDMPSLSPSTSPTTLQEARASSIKKHIAMISDSGSLQDSTSPQNKAMQWVIYQDQRKLNSEASNLIQRYVLMVFYYALSGNSWKYKLGYGGIQHECKWYGVTCNSNLEITQLKLVSNNLSGKLPAEISELANLNYIYLPNNGLTGTIPSSITNLTNLQQFWCYNNLLSGFLPQGIGSLTKLTHLLVYNNKLIGKIPKGIETLTNLRNVWLNDNFLSGTIPNLTRSLNSLLYVSLWRNELTGSIPPDIGSWAKLQQFYVAINRITGTLPANLGNLTKLTHFYVFENQITGFIPATLGSLKNLDSLKLHKNNLVGTVPQSLCNLSLTTFIVDCGGSNPEVNCPCCTHCWL